MTVIAHVVLRGVDHGTYDRVRAECGWLERQPTGGIAHLTWWEDGDSHSIDAWDSESAFETFGQERLGPAMAALGLAIEPEVTFHPAHEVYLPEKITIANGGGARDQGITLQSLEQAFALARAVLTGVEPDQHEAPTPCASWNVRALANHLVEGANWFALCVDGGAAPDPDPTKGVDYAAGDLAASFDEGAQASLRAFGRPDALTKDIVLPFGTWPGAQFLAIATQDVFVHAWDLATATGQPTALDPQLAQALLPVAEGIPDEFRGPDGEAPFGPRRQAPADAGPSTRLAAILGRTV